MIFFSKKSFIILIIAMLALGLGASFVIISTYKTDFLADMLDTLSPQAPAKQLQNPPAILKSVYVTGWSIGSKKYQAYLSDLFKTTQINAVVLDVKDASGIVSYKTGAPMAKKYKAYYPEISNIDTLIQEFHDQGIYVIGRIVVFEDITLAKNRPDLAVYNKSKTQDVSKPVLWGNNNSVLWVDPASKEVWDYNIEIAKDALAHGFDEINFDYVRFPTDGQLDNMGFPVWDKLTPRHVVIKSFFQKLRESLPDARISADLFGQTTSNTDDMGIGQVFEDALSYFDYVCPMLYPSHYANGFMGYSKPAEHPYGIIKYEMDSAALRKKAYAAVSEKLNTTAPAAVTLAKIRPWLQDFNLGAKYDTPMVLQEIKAVTDSIGEDFTGFMLWNPSNMYTKGAITATK